MLGNGNRDCKSRRHSAAVDVYITPFIFYNIICFGESVYKTGGKSLKKAKTVLRSGRKM
jgi:hypothetical protein